VSETAGLEACKIKVFPPAFWPIRMDTLYDAVRAPSAWQHR
jgi:hypothetical protein